MTRSRLFTDLSKQFSLKPVLFAVLLCSGLANAFADEEDKVESNNDTAVSSVLVNKSNELAKPKADSGNSFQTPWQSYTQTDGDLWQRIRDGYAIPSLSQDNQQLNQQLNWYGARTNHIVQTVQRGARYLYHVVQELEKRGMPTELALLPIIESAFNPQAISSAKATGMWQFMAATGRDFNLKQTLFKDDRRGVINSTEAALNYLQKLHGMFGDWQLALAAYNWGEGSVLRAIKKQQAKSLPTDFQSISVHMPDETRNYLPKLQAVKTIIEHPEQFNLNLPKVENQPYFVAIEKSRDIDVKVAAQLAELPVQEFMALNPQFNRPVITGDTKILLPWDSVAKYQENLSKWEGPLSNWSAVTVAKTERVENLAARLGTQPELIREANMIPAKMLVKAGSTVLVPKTAASQDQDIAPEIAENAQLALEKNATRTLRFKVGKRDNLASIAKRYQVSVDDIKSWNHLKRDALSQGQSLQIQVAAVSGSNKSLTKAKPYNKPVSRVASNRKTVVAHNKNSRRKHS